MINRTTECEAIKHALKEYPKESVGFVVLGKYLPVENHAKEPNDEFAVEIGKDYPQGLTALMHSHPKGNPEPTALDMRTQEAMDVPWGIVPIFQDGATAGPITWLSDTMWDEPPLLGREFMHGISDCYSLVRDYYWQEKEMILPIYPRSIGWQDRGEDLLSINEFMRCGFERVLHNAIECGDIILFKIHSKLNNHCGVYVGNNLLLHHLQNRLSRREPINPWLKMADSCWRPTGQTERLLLGSG